jgi:hypothetical protein
LLGVVSETDLATLAGGPACHGAATVFWLAELVAGGHLTNAIHRLLDAEIVTAGAIAARDAAGRDPRAGDA